MSGDSGSAEDSAPGGLARLERWRLALLAALVAVLAALVLLPGLDATGLWSEGELAVLDRSLAALGEPRAELVRHPWLPDALRTLSYELFGRRDFGLRLPGALAGVGLVLMTFAAARKLGWSLPWVAVASGFALSMPLLLAGGRTVLGNPVGELCVSVAAVALVAAGNQNPELDRSRGVRAALAGLGLLALAGGVASLGVVLGGCLPLVLVALADVARDPEQGAVSLPRWLVAAAWTGAAVAGFCGLWLAWNQGEGYIPLLGAAKDLDLIEDPTKREFSDALEEFGYQAFPFTGLVAIGLLSPGRARWPALWLAVALVFTSLWSQVYGPTPAPVIVPAALLATAAAERMLDPDEPIAARRLMLTCALLGALILGKDAGRTPAEVASPLLHFSEIEFPSAHLELGERLGGHAKRFAALLLLAHLVAPPSRDQLRWREQREAPWWLRRWRHVEAVLDRLLTGRGERSGLRRARRLLPYALLIVALAGHAVVYGRVILGQVSEQMSIAGPLARWDQLIHDGDLPEPRLGLHRIRDPGLEVYGPGPKRELYLSHRADLDKFLFDDRPRTALIRRKDLPPAFSSARTHGEPFYVLDDSHHDYVLVGNFLPEGHEDQNPLTDIVVDVAPELAKQTRVAWGPYVELVAWEIEGPVHRGSVATMHLVFEVQRPLPAGAKLYARLQKGKVSRVAAKPHELTGGVFPPNYWRPGDIIHHRHEMEVPWLEVLPGEHDLIVGMRRSEKTNFEITTPAEGKKRGEFGVEIKGKKHEFAIIGQVEVAW